MIRTRLSSALALLLLVTALPGCAARQPALDGFTIGFSTPSGNRIWVREAEFNGSWDVPVGNLACCWKEAGPLYGVGPGPMPSSVRVLWDDESRGLIYEARTELPRDLTEQALSLPKYEVKSSGRKDRARLLIIGLRDNGSMVVWLSNAMSASNQTGRVLHKVGTAEGRIVREMRPEEHLTVDD